LKKKRKLFLDFDQTTGDSITTVCNLYNIDYCNKIGFIKAKPHLVTEWNFSGQCNLINKKKIDKYFSSKRFFEDVQFIENAKSIIDELSKTFDIYIVSMGGFKNLYLKRKWCNKNLPYAKFIGCNFLLHKDKRHIRMSKDDVFIDDSLNNLINSSCGTRLLYGDVYDWNCKNEELGLFRRCWNWTEIYNHLME
jgi:5'(3')-deoxyribonucleotidase